MKTPVSSDGFNWELAPLHLGQMQERHEREMAQVKSITAGFGKKEKDKVGRCKLDPGLKASGFKV